MNNYPRLSSASQMRMLNDCARKYHYKYIEKIPEPTTPIRMIEGSAIHAGLQCYYEALMLGKLAPETDEMKGYAHEEFNKRIKQAVDKESALDFEYVDKSKTNKKKTIDDSLRWIGRAIDAFAASPYIPAGVVDVEHRFELKVGDCERAIVGYIDLIAVDKSGAIVVVDHKTGSKRAPTRKLLTDAGNVDTGLLDSPDIQMGIYKLAALAHFGDSKEIKVAHQKIVVQKTKADCQLFEFYEPDYFLSETVEAIHSNFDRLDLLTEPFNSKILFQRTRSNFCGTCQYKKICEDDRSISFERGSIDE